MPSESLPAEIIGDIIKYFIASTVIDGKADTLVPLRVCRKWREIAQQMNCINILHFQADASLYQMREEQQYLKASLAALRQFIQRCNLIRGGLVDLSLKIVGTHCPLIGIIEDAIERLPALRTYSEKDGSFGVMLRVLPRLREEQYAYLTYLDLLTTDDYEDGFTGFEGNRLCHGRVFPLPNLKTLRIARNVPPMYTLPFLDCPSLTTLILTGWNSSQISFESVIGAIERYPTLRHIITDVDFYDTTRNPDWNVHEGVQHLALGGDELFMHPYDLGIYPEEQQAIDLSEITSVFPNLSNLTLKELSMVGCGVVRSPNLQELNLIWSSVTLYGCDIRDISAEIRLFLASVPNLCILRLGDSSRETHIRSFASLLPHTSNQYISTFISQLFQVLAEETPTEGTGQRTLAFCNNLKVVELIRIQLDLQLLKAIDKNVHLRGDVYSKGVNPRTSKCLFKIKECTLPVSDGAQLTTSKEEMRQFIQLSTSPCVSFE
jgi:hypothetical protein